MKIKNVSGENRVIQWEGVKYYLPFAEESEVPDELGMVLVNQPYFMKITKKPKKSKKTKRGD